MSDENIVYVPLGFFEKYFNIDHYIDSIELHLYHPLIVDKIITKIFKKIHTPFLTYTWINDYRSIYHDIKKIKITVYLALSLLIIISCFNIASISLMTISKKSKDIAILRSLGASNIMIQLIFLYYGLRSILIGTFMGLFLGIIIIINYKKITCIIEQAFPSSILFNNIYYNNFFLLKIDLVDVVTVFSSTILVGLLTNWYPAYYASKINPRNILKEY